MGDACGPCPCPAHHGQAKGRERSELTEFYLGTHMVNWLWERDLFPLFQGVTFFVSRVRIATRVSRLLRALHPYCIDSGGFTELQRHGRWTLTAPEYVAEIRRYLAELGASSCRWVAPQDWMCERQVIFGGAGRRGVLFHGTQEARGVAPGAPEQDMTTAVRTHQRLTVDNALELRALAPDIPFILVLQGNTFEDYTHCAQLYTEAGIDLTAEPVVGLGSVCRRQGTSEIGRIARHFATKGVRLHGFGVKTLGLASYADALVSADSMAWSEDARYSAPLPGHTHRSCSSCPDWAVRWHRRIVRQHLAPDQ
ncbi:deazapurine DNA modification protein DpdA family protein [Streptomyces sp. NPDC001493]